MKETIMDKNAESIKEYWNNRATLDSSIQSTTMDIWLRHIEAEFLTNVIKKYNPKKICDIGCGDGLTTIKCAKENPNADYVGFDYSKSMIGNAINNAKNYELKNINFFVNDITDELESQSFDFIYTTRCLINLTDWSSQVKALVHIQKLLLSGGLYVLIENFIEGQNQFNSLREKFDLPVIPVRDHNTFFEREKLLSHMNEHFEILDEVNVSSTYYMVSRIIYSSICKNENLAPEYDDVHHRLAASLPFSGEYGPVRAIVFRKKG